MEWRCQTKCQSKKVNPQIIEKIHSTALMYTTGLARKAAYQLIVLIKYIRAKVAQPRRSATKRLP